MDTHAEVPINSNQHKFHNTLHTNHKQWNDLVFAEISSLIAAMRKNHRYSLSYSSSFGLNPDSGLNSQVRRYDYLGQVIKHDKSGVSNSLLKLVAKSQEKRPFFGDATLIQNLIALKAELSVVAGIVDCSCGLL